MKINKIQLDKINSFCNCEYVTSLSGKKGKVNSCFKHKGNNTEIHRDGSVTIFQKNNRNNTISINDIPPYDVSYMWNKTNCNHVFHAVGHKEECIKCGYNP